MFVIVVVIELKHIDAVNLYNILRTQLSKPPTQGAFFHNDPGNALSATPLPVLLNTTVGLEAEGQKPWVKVVEGLEQRVAHMEGVIKRLHGGEEKEVQQQVDIGTLRMGSSKTKNTHTHKTTTQQLQCRLNYSFNCLFI